MSRDVFPAAGFLQFETTLGAPEVNVAKVRRLIEELAPAPDSLLALPELWATGFDYANAVALAGQTPDILVQLTGLAREHNIVLAGSLLEPAESRSVGGAPFNTLFLVGPAGVLGGYRKNHLFRPWQEERHFTPGDCDAPIQTPFGLVGGLVCYDLRFPEIARHQAFLGAGLLVVSAQWPKKRLDHWLALLRARAIENQVFVVAANGCGVCGDHLLAGHSLVVGPDGTVLARAEDRQEAGLARLEAGSLAEVRQAFCPAGERSLIPRSREKILSLKQLRERLLSVRRQGSRVAFTNGCFDLLHSGHVAYLEQARQTADCLVVGLNSDKSVRALKGAGRPVNHELDRARVLAGLASVDYVVIFDEETPISLINSLRPDVLVKGADWAEEDIVGATEVKAAGGRVVRVQFEHALSTTRLIERVRRND